MKTLSVPPIDAEIEGRISQMIRSGSALEVVILAMRQSGLNKIESIKLLRNYAGMTLTEGKSAVHLSQAWRDRLEYDNAFHDHVIEAANILGFKEETQ